MDGCDVLNLFGGGSGGMGGLHHIDGIYLDCFTVQAGGY